MYRDEGGASGHVSFDRCNTAGLECMIVTVLRVVVFAACVAALGACDNKPNADFEQSQKDRQASSMGDRYAMLEDPTMPTPSQYARRDAALRRDFAAGRAATYRASYDSMLAQLDTDPKVDRRMPLFTQCRPAFDKASGFQTATARGALPATDERETTVAALLSCREAAQESLKNGDQGRDTAALLSRFASTGLALVGVTQVGAGDEANGLPLWRRGSELAAQDKPGFQIGVGSFINH